MLKIFLLFLLFFPTPSVSYYGMEESVCKDKKHFVDCFGWTHSDCLVEARKGLYRCVSVMPKQPKPMDTIEEELAVPSGRSAGTWGILLGHCAEVSMYYMNTNKIKNECGDYFEARVKSLDDNPFGFTVGQVRKALGKRLPREIDFNKPLNPADLVKGINKSKNHLIKTILVNLLGGLLPFVFLAGFIWMKTKWSYYSVALALSPFSWFLALCADVYSKQFAKSIAIYGDNPMAMGPSFYAWILLGIVYWPTLYLVYRKTRVTVKISKEIKESQI